MSVWSRMLHDSSLSLRKAIADRKLILLFYKEFEKDKFIKYDRYLKRVVRPVYNLTHARVQAGPPRDLFVVREETRFQIDLSWAIKPNAIRILSNKRLNHASRRRKL